MPVMSAPPGFNQDHPHVPISELVLADQIEAQGWRVRLDERLDRLFEERCDWLNAYGRPDQLAVESDALSLTYDELDGQANRMARYLRLHGAKAGDRIALLFDRPTDAYVTMLAALKIGCTYVPLDVSYPADQMAAIVGDAGVRTVLSMSHVADRVEQLDRLIVSGAEVVYLDLAAPLIDEQDSRRLIKTERGFVDNPIAYITYHSDSRGQPQGVTVDHRSICNFVKVAAEVYGIRPRDRVYQGLSVAVDFSVEEIWIPWFRGATLVPTPPGPKPRGKALHGFLRDHRVTALRCAPSLLATIEDDLPDLRFLLVSGEACPRELIARWHRPGRRLLNAYGPTEATVTATWTELHPDKRVTIGTPLPTYSTVILDIENPYRALPHGQIGEIGIAGIGLARGYLNRDDLTEEAFIPDFLGIPANPSGRIYRTGDLGRVNADRQIEYHGRLDPHGRVGGYRTDLVEAEPAPRQVPEIESVLRQFTEIAQAMASTTDLAVAGTDQATAVEPTTSTETKLAEVLADVVQQRVSIGSHFFDDLGADSMVMARFCARVRKIADLPSISIKDVYQHPTIRSLAAALAPASTNFRESSCAPSIEVLTQAARGGLHLPARIGKPRFVLCGTLQLLFLLGYAYLATLVAIRGAEWISAGSGLLDIFLRAAVFGGASLVAACTLPILAKWMLIGRWKPRQIRVWSLAYFRFWLVKTLIRSNPLVLFAGSPLYPLYLKALGAKIGRGVVIFSPNMPVCTDLLSIGDGTVIRKDSFFSCYRAHDGLIQTGPVTLGKHVFVGEMTVLDIGTSLGDEAQLGHTSSLHAGQAVPAGERWHGSPAQRTEVNYRAADPIRCGRLRRAVWALLQLVGLLGLLVPLGFGGVIMVLSKIPRIPALLAEGPLAFRSWTFYLEAMAASYVLFLGSVLVGLLVVAIVPRVFGLAIKPDKSYCLYGFRYGVQRVITRMTNIRFFTELFGDSSYIVHYLRCLGYALSPVEQTGSNFGGLVKHESPYLSSVGSGTVVADGLSIINADFSNTSFRLSRASIGRHNFLGNNIAYPSQGRTGDNCLLATKVMVPIDGEIREGVGLLGSPSFEIPRSVERDTGFELKSKDELCRRLASKNAHNVVSIALRLLVRWIYFFGVILLALSAADVYDSVGAAGAALANILILLFGVVYFVLVDRAVQGLQALTPLGCSIYDRFFWRHERFWKVTATAYIQAFNGTPFKNVIWRSLGARVGRRVFDDGSFMSERTFVTIGDGCTLNAGSILQSHSQEDGAFKSDRISIGAGCTLGVGAFVHYGVTMGDGATLAPDSFLMKGEEIPPGEQWGGNPAMEMRNDFATQASCRTR